MTAAHGGAHDKSSDPYTHAKGALRVDTSAIPVAPDDELIRLCLLVFEVEERIAALEDQLAQLRSDPDA